MFGEQVVETIHHIVNASEHEVLTFIFLGLGDGFGFMHDCGESAVDGRDNRLFF